MSSFSGVDLSAQLSTNGRQTDARSCHLVCSQRVTLRACGVCEDLALARVQKNTTSDSTHSFRRNSIIIKVSFSLESGHLKQNAWFFKRTVFGLLLPLELELGFCLAFREYLFGILSLAYVESAKVGSKRQSR